MLLDRDLDPLFWDNLRQDTPSAWHGHVPFAHWLVSTLRPRTIVELGTHAGVSYAAFCNAVERCGLGTACTAVDSWAGDDHAGAYPEAVYDELRAFHDPRFGPFSRLLRSSFDDAMPEFADGSIDLLHIDGFHSYDAVRHDYETWRPKLSPNAVILFHDTDVRVRDFGVWRFWAEIRGSGAGSLDFTHAFGLGMLLLGTPHPDLLALCHAPVHQVRARFAVPGERMVLLYDRAHQAATVPDAAPTPTPVVDPTLFAGTIHIAERFTAPPGLHAVRLPVDAVTRGESGCTVWLVSPDGTDWRQGRIAAVPQGETVTLRFAAFSNPRPAHFHLFVTDACEAGAGLPQALADLLSQRRAPIAIDTPDLAPIARGLTLWQNPA